MTSEESRRERVVEALASFVPPLGVSVIRWAYIAPDDHAATDGDVGLSRSAVALEPDTRMIVFWCRTPLGERFRITPVLEATGLDDANHAVFGEYLRKNLAREIVRMMARADRLHGAV